MIGVESSQHGLTTLISHGLLPALELFHLWMGGLESITVGSILRNVIVVARGFHPGVHVRAPGILWQGVPDIPCKPLPVDNDPLPTVFLLKLRTCHVDVVVDVLVGVLGFVIPEVGVLIQGCDESSTNRASCISKSDSKVATLFDGGRWPAWVDERLHANAPHGSGVRVKL